MDGQWVETITIEDTSKEIVTKRAAALRRQLTKLEKHTPGARRSKGEGAFYKRPDGLWEAAVEMPRGPDGRRRRRTVAHRDRATVVEMFAKLKDEVGKGLEPQDKRLTVQGWLEYWIDAIAKPRMRPHPWKSYSGHVRNQLIPAIGHQRLATLQPEHIRYLHKWILAHTYTRGKGKNAVQIPYTTRTAEAAHRVLNTALNDAIAEGKVHRNVAEIVGAPGVLSQSHGALTSEQARAVLLG